MDNKTKKWIIMNHKYKQGRNAKNHALLALLFLLLGGNAWGQDYSGIYYIANAIWNGSNTGSEYYWYNVNTPEYNWYLVPGADSHLSHYSDAYFNNQYSNNNNNNGSNDYTGDNYGDPEKPFLTTYRTNRDSNSIWIVKKTGDDYYIIHARTGKFIKYEITYQNYPARKTMHLEDVEGGNPGDVFKYEITENSNSAQSITGFNIRVKNLTSGDRYFNPAGDNWPRYYGTQDGNKKPYSSGMVGIYKSEDNASPLTKGSLWPYEDASATLTPIITDNGDHTVTISMPTGYEVYDVYYTTDGSTPTASSAHATGSVTISDLPADYYGWIKAKAGRFDVLTTTKDSLYVDFNTIAQPTMNISGCDNSITLSCTSPETSIYYTLDGSEPTEFSTLYTEPFYAADGTTVKSIAYRYTNHSAVATQNVVYTHTALPTITFSLTTLTCILACPDNDATIFYTYTTDNTEPSDPNPDDPSQAYNNFPIDIPQNTTFWIKAIAKSSSLLASCVVENSIFLGNVINDLTSLQGITGNNHYLVVADIDASGLQNSIAGFSGTLESVVKEDGTFYTISGLNKPLFASTDGATIRNLTFDNVNITSGTNVGTLVAEADGATRIYNVGILGGSVSGSGNVGGIVGLLDGSSRVINCFSYANITGGDLVGGIVGKNAVATTATNLKTMVMNCMFYGDITGGTSKAPIYNGEIITNRSDQSGVSNFNYFWAGASYVQGQDIDVYNCALAAETRYLQRFEFFRHLLNSNRELAAWWATGDFNDKDEMSKWVLEPSQIGTSTPYPILKAPRDSENHIIKYSSVVNIDAANAEAFSPDPAVAKTQYNQGRKFDTFTINIQNVSSGAPDGATITTASVITNITDKDPAHFNFNYYKVQLPYYNDVGSHNYTNNKVVTGWKIVTIASGTHSFSTTGSDASAVVDENGDITLTTTPYNFADRKCTDKDKFSVSGRVFSQGAYFDVPEGVTSITIEPYWAKCVYVSDAYPDVIYNDAMSTASNVTTVGTVEGAAHYTNNTEYPINGDNQKVYTTMGNAVTALNPSGTVYDNAIVLVGNFHSLSLSSQANDKPFTIMSIDLDKDNEPDYSYILSFNGRVRVHPVRIDFLNVMGLGMAQKSIGGQGTYNFGIMQPYGWFESTNTSLFHVTQFEYDRKERVNAPIILHGGVIEQWVTVAETGNTQPDPANAVTYYHVGSNVWFKEFHIGAHQDRQAVVSKHPPISVTGGDFDEFYLTGLYNTPNTNYDDNAECYINGGRFGKVAGTGMQGIGHATNHTNGNIIWQIDNADIDEFYAGGINAAHIAEGNIFTVISNSRVDLFCGGPKFGDMNNGKKVVTNASNCVFRTFFGAGYGGNSYNREYPTNKYDKYNYEWNTWLGQVYDNVYKSEYKGVATRIDYQFIPRSNNLQNVARLFVDYISFSLATTRDVTSKLNDCTITTSELGRLDLFDGCIGNFYGGGSLGKVEGPVKSTLTNCTVEGNVYGAGYSATLPSVSVMNNAFQKEPYYDVALGAYFEAILPTTVTYTWEHAETVNSTETAIDTDTHKLFTTVDINKTNLGSVNAVSLTIKGNSKIGTAGNADTGHVFGGGEESRVVNDTEVKILEQTKVYGNIYGGGNMGTVGGNTKVIVNGQNQ